GRRVAPCRDSAAVPALARQGVRERAAEGRVLSFVVDRFATAWLIACVRRIGWPGPWTGAQRTAWQRRCYIPDVWTLRRTTRCNVARLNGIHDATPNCGRL